VDILFDMICIRELWGMTFMKRYLQITYTEAT
jgi:hypothetical protein